MRLKISSNFYFYNLKKKNNFINVNKNKKPLLLLINYLFFLLNKLNIKFYKNNIIKIFKLCHFVYLPHHYKNFIHSNFLNKLN